jgi:hypothetical protein
MEKRNMFTTNWWAAALIAGIVLLRSQAVGQDGLAELLDENNKSHPATLQTTQKPPAPAAAISRQAIAEVKEIFAEDYTRATTPPRKFALAQQLLGQVDKTTAAAEQWALVSEVMRLASDAGDIELSFAAIEKAGGLFAIDVDGLKLDAISKLATKAPLPALDGLARAALSIAQNATDAGNSAIATKSLSLASGLARKTKNRTLVAEATKIQQSARDYEKELREKAAIEAKLAAQPGDPEVCLEAGKYFCFKADEWSRGLPLLAKGSDTDLARLAVGEVNGGKSVDAVVSLADAWWDWAQQERGTGKTAGTAHAADLYETILPKTSGLDRARMEKRVQESNRDRNGRRERRSHVADLKEHSTKNIVGVFTKDGSYEGAAFTCGNQAWPKSLVFIAYEKSPSVTFTIPEGARRLVGKVGIFTPATGVNASMQPQEQQIFEILLDGKTAWKSPALSKRDETADFDVPLFDAQRVELKATSKTIARSWTAWLDPEFIY